MLAVKKGQEEAGKTQSSVLGTGNKAARVATPTGGRLRAEPLCSALAGREDSNTCLVLGCTVGLSTAGVGLLAL